ncbi:MULTISPECIES: leucine-rich repeat-containing protein kinase family protein [unclassified Pseudomonas]|uniref:leucine-rich repeat-containing protein kinase family protein n=1 Tax=unclassified Pseudomonas TaxID=196821 RepID=UPI002AC9E634|nr:MULTISPECIES: leucine-rich repeat-containing protein kinase family protein [unclassified Pseudomonas]MEB0041336.1 leucine-rich repeat-containing protein kinase family protein [Pseudomonas sp. MH10]MEB0076260.1 leucine-rich repeat-containing protein kinase family protein [Pseudomonas sp. MH10out]MEB0090755.1 leucine-rich repeat-containing protein kinase family protein [Pseudomonas sp. CCI4.2]MEB0100567.1 leucine-rich repeat-containing protein kinase family protein [Pseudomonas sp. CCI3.2]MEB
MMMGADKRPHTLERLRAGQLDGIKRLDLSCALVEFPAEIFDLADSLETLNLTGNALSSLPADLYRLKKLRVLFCSQNQFTELPACIGQCSQLQIVGFKANRIQHVPAEALPPLLRWLILTDNGVKSLPEALGDCARLQKLMLAGNQLRSLPASLARCTQLELVRISANHLTSLPDWLLKLPALAWLAYAGNPLPTHHAETPIRQVVWSHLDVQHQLGEGASGVIQQALWQAPEQIETSVAIKLYKGSITSDGSPLNEMAACIAAGAHPNLITVEGQIADHPHDQVGLVMQLIAPHFGNLAGPPSLESCTRDIYPANTVFSLETALRLARGIASVAEHLHACHLSHGDLYAHNILWNQDGECLLGDFGAASFHPTEHTDQPALLERIEVRAFGILLGELLERCGAQEAGLLTLQRQCIQPDVSARPSFVEVNRVLQTF